MVAAWSSLSLEWWLMAGKAHLWISQASPERFSTLGWTAPSGCWRCPMWRALAVLTPHPKLLTDRARCGEEIHVMGEGTVRCPCLSGAQAGQQEEFGDHSALWSSKTWEASTGSHGLVSGWGAGFLLEIHTIYTPPNMDYLDRMHPTGMVSSGDSPCPKAPGPQPF